MKQKKISKILLVLFVLFTLGCKQEKDHYNISCVGDSITYGNGIKNTNNSYPFQLEKMLGKRFTVRNYGRSSATMLRNGNLPYWIQREYNNAMRSNPDLVIIMLGTNDTKPQNWKYKSLYKKDYKNLINQFKQLSTHPKVWIALPPPVFEDKYGLKDSVVFNELLPLIKEIAKEENLKLIDNNTLFKNKPELFNDGIHPNEKGAKVMAENIAKEIKLLYNK